MRVSVPAEVRRSLEKVFPLHRDRRCNVWLPRPDRRTWVRAALRRRGARPPAWRLCLVARLMGWVTALLVVAVAGLHVTWLPPDVFALGSSGANWTDRVPYAGWAVVAYPAGMGSPAPPGSTHLDPDAEMEEMIRRIAQAGANVIWIGHNNPGEVALDKLEPGLSYAVYEAYLDPADQRHQAAVATVEAQHRILTACRTVGIRAVLPVGYQIQMGEVWNEAHPLDLRRDAEGRPLDIYGGGVSASFYAPGYRQAIRAYYRWVDSEFVQPYADVLLMLNLADEPIGGDYSIHADAEFRRQTGHGFDNVSTDPSLQVRLGEFQSRYVVEYAIYSASLWLEINPDLPVTMSFDGAQARAAWTMPDVEALFRDTPSNFVVTFDAYPRDGLPHVALSDKDLVELFLLGRSIGLYSARYGKPVWLWAAANSWGLSQDSPDPGTISDAVANGYYLALLVRQGGGHLQGIAYWNYNVKEQGLYNNPRPTTYDPDEMFHQVSAAFPTLRRLMLEPPGNPDILILAPPVVAYQQIGASREATRLEVHPYSKLEVLSRAGVNAAVVGSLDGWSLATVRAIVILSPAAVYLESHDLRTLADFLEGGGSIVASAGVAAALDESAGKDEPPFSFGGLVSRRGRLYTATHGVAVLFEGLRHESLMPFWSEVLGLEHLGPGYLITTDRAALYYNRGPEPVEAYLTWRFEGAGTRYDDRARPVERIHSPYAVATLARREFVLAIEGPPFWPVAECRVGAPFGP